MRRTIATALVALTALALTACGGSSGWSQVEDAGIPISYSDYYKLCDVHSGDFIKGMNVERSWTKAQDAELRGIIAQDSRCQPD